MSPLLGAARDQAIARRKGRHAYWAAQAALPPHSKFCAVSGFLRYYWNSPLFFSHVSGGGVRSSSMAETAGHGALVEGGAQARNPIGQLAGRGQHHEAFAFPGGVENGARDRLGRQWRAGGRAVEGKNRAIAGKAGAREIGGHETRADEHDVYALVVEFGAQHLEEAVEGVLAGAIAGAGAMRGAKPAMLLSTMICPCPAITIGSAAFVSATVPEEVDLHNAAVDVEPVCTQGLTCVRPAQWTRMSSRPNCSRMRATASRRFRRKSRRRPAATLRRPCPASAAAARSSASASPVEQGNLRAGPGENARHSPADATGPAADGPLRFRRIPYACFRFLPFGGFQRLARPERGDREPGDDVPEPPTPTRPASCRRIRRRTKRSG